MFSCKRCKRDFDSKNILHKHPCVVKKKSTVDDLDFEQYNYKYCCAYCNKKFEREFFLTRHVNSKNTPCYSTRTKM
jgi:hypothetical protein